MLRNNATAQEAVIIDMGDLRNMTNATIPTNDNTSNTGNKDEKDKKSDTLFGPNIGILATGPAWTESGNTLADDKENEKKLAVDPLTPEIVKGWIAKSKEVSPLNSLIHSSSQSASDFSAHDDPTSPRQS